MFKLFPSALHRGGSEGKQGERLLRDGGRLCSWTQACSVSFGWGGMLRVPRRGLELRQQLSLCTPCQGVKQHAHSQITQSTIDWQCQERTKSSKRDERSFWATLETWDEQYHLIKQTQLLNTNRATAKFHPFCKSYSLWTTWRPASVGANTTYVLGLHNMKKKKGIAIIFDCYCNMVHHTRGNSHVWNIITIVRYIKMVIMWFLSEPISDLVYVCTVCWPGYHYSATTLHSEI